MTTYVRVGDERHRFTTEVGTESKTKQSFRDDCDINKIVARYKATGMYPQTGKTPTYGDFSMADGLHSAMNLVQEAQQEFDRLPSAVRNLCENNPENLLRALADEELTAELAEAGLQMSEDYEPPVKQKDEPPASVGDQAESVPSEGD